MAFLTAGMVLRLLLAAGSGSDGGAPVVSVVAQPDLDCPAAPVINRALAAALVREGTPPAKTDGGWTLFVNRTGGSVAVSLRDAGGVAVLSRALAADPRGCQSAAEAIALIVERYFRDVVWTADLPRVNATSPSTAPTVVAGPRPAAPSESGPMFSAPPRLAIGAGPSVWTRQGAVSLALDARVRLVGPILLGAGTLLPSFSTEQTLGSAGSARVSAVPVTGSLGVSGTRGRFGGTVGLGALVTFERGQSLGIAQPATERRMVLAAGLGLGTAVAVSARFRLALEAAGYRALFGRSFVVDGIPGTVLEPPGWQGVFRLQVEWLAWR